MNILPILTQLLGGRDSLKAVKVGANDGIVNDPTWSLIDAHPGWELLCIEPHPRAYARLEGHLAGRPGTVLQRVAIDAHEGVRELWTVDTEAARSVFGVGVVFLDQISSFDRETVARSNPKAEPFLKAIEVATAPLASVLEATGFVDASFVQIDTEGHDFEVLRQWPFARHKPDVFLYESVHLPQAIYQASLMLLDVHGYTALELGHDIIAMKKGP